LLLACLPMTKTPLGIPSADSRKSLYRQVFVGWDAILRRVVNR
jgi:hypothetical protein